MYTALLVNKKSWCKRILSLLIVACLISAMMAPVLAASKPNVKYTTTNAVNVQTFMGFYKPGTLTISTSKVSNAGKNILESASLVCSILPSLPGCQFVKAANWYVSYIPNVRYQVWLYDAGNGKLVWNGYLNSGADIRLGNDHPKGYNVYIASTKLADCFTFVGLVPK